MLITTMTTGGQRGISLAHRKQPFWVNQIRLNSLHHFFNRQESAQFMDDNVGRVAFVRKKRFYLSVTEWYAKNFI